MESVLYVSACRSTVDVRTRIGEKLKTKIVQVQYYAFEYFP